MLLQIQQHDLRRLRVVRRQYSEHELVSISGPGWIQFVLPGRELLRATTVGRDNVNPVRFPWFRTAEGDARAVGRPVGHGYLQWGVGQLKALASIQFASPQSSIGIGDVGCPFA